MRNILFVLLFVLINFVAKAQIKSFMYKTPEAFPKEFSQVSYEYMTWYNDNTDVMCYNFTAIDNAVSTVIKNNPNIQDLDLLTTLLSKPCKNDLEKARAYYIWIINSMVYDVAIRDSYTSAMRSNDNREAEAIYCFKNRKGACLEMSSIFYTMCKRSGVRSFIIGGFFKDVNASNDGYQEVGHAWNVFKYGERYFFLDATFGLQTKYKSDVYINTHFIINSNLYKYLYTPHDIYGNLSYKFDGSIYSTEKDWRLFSKEYKNANRINDADWVEFNIVLVIVDTDYKMKHSEWLVFPVFGYENYNLQNVKKWATNYKTETVETNLGVCSVDTFILLKEKEYKKLKPLDRMVYNKKAEEYLPYWINYNKMMADKNKSNPELFQAYTKDVKKFEYDFTYYKIFKK
ncbi:MAG: hypothetical protein RLZZ546_1496 [Bacteroidota bacterium]|jgi:hypothetical protein